MHDLELRVPTHDSTLAGAVAAFCREHVLHRAAAGPAATRKEWQAVRDAGSALWLDAADLDHNREAWSQEFSGLAMHTASLGKEVGRGRYDALVPQAAETLRRTEPTLAAADVIREVAFTLDAIHGLTLATSLAADVSVPLHADLWHDAAAAYEYGLRLHQLCPERFVVQVPLTPEGLCAAHRLGREGVRVECTLGFSPRQLHLIAGFAQPHFADTTPARVAEFFERAGSGSNPANDPGEATTLVCQRMLRDLVDAQQAPAHVRLVASALRDGSQVPRLAGVDVLAMPVAVAQEFAAFGFDARRIRDRTREAGTHPATEPPADADGGSVFFAIRTEARVACEQLKNRDLEAMDGPRVRAVLADNGLGDLFPELTQAERERLAADGEVPDAAAFEAGVAEGNASWDGLLTEAALAVATAEREKLDGRLRELLG